MSFRIGLMGCGAVAGYGHLPAIRETDGLELAAIFDPDPQRLQAARERFDNPPAYDDTDAFFRSGLDAVVVTSPVGCHRENVLQAAEHHLAVLCEKPLGADAGECREMIDAMAAAGAALHVGFTLRFSTVATAIRRLVADGAVGPVRALRMISNWHCHGKYVLDDEGQPAIQQRRHLRMIEGGPLVDCGTHLIDLSRWWLGSEVVRFSGHGAWVEEPYEAPDHVWAHLDLADGAHATIEASFTYCHTTADRRAEHVYELIGPEGLIRYCAEDRQLILYRPDETREFPAGGAKGFPEMYAEFVRALETGSSQVLATDHDGLEAVRISRGATRQAIAARRAISAGSGK